jgi:hypothetical protein
MNDRLCVGVCGRPLPVYHILFGDVLIGREAL